jgi:hypothetical protein
MKRFYIAAVLSLLAALPARAQEHVVRSDRWEIPVGVCTTYPGYHFSSRACSGVEEPIHSYVERVLLQEKGFALWQLVTIIRSSCDARWYTVVLKKR